MIILDTDHFVTLKYSGSERFARLAQRMADSKDQDFVTTAITFEEQMRGQLAHVSAVFVDDIKGTERDLSWPVMTALGWLHHDLNILSRAQGVAAAEISAWQKSLRPSTSCP